jgi:hypothetical protein
MANLIKMLLPLRLYAGKHFFKTLRFFTISFNQANAVYVKMYETAQLTLFYVFLNKTNIHVNFANVLWVVILRLK